MKTSMMNWIEKYMPDDHRINIISNQKMISILFFSNFASLKKGGQRSLWYLLQGIDRTLCKLVLACQETGDLTEYASNNSIPVEILKTYSFRPSNLFKIIHLFCALHKIINNYNIQIIHSEDLRIVFMAGLIRIYKPIKIIWHVRVVLRSLFQKKIGIYLCDKIICVSKASFDSFGNTKKTALIHNGIDSSVYKPEKARIETKLFCSGDVLIGYIGNMIESKGVHVLIKAMPEILKKYPRVKCLLVGKGKDEEYFRKLAVALKIERNIIFWGEENNPKDLLNRMDIFCFPSFAEGLSRSLLEAMALEKPIVASNIEGNTELILVNKTGLLFEKDNPNDLAEKIMQILDFPDFAKTIGAAARIHVSENFKISDTTKNVQSLYEELLNDLIENLRSA